MGCPPLELGRTPGTPPHTLSFGNRLTLTNPHSFGTSFSLTICFCSARLDPSGIDLGREAFEYYPRGRVPSSDDGTPHLDLLSQPLALRLRPGLNSELPFLRAGQHLMHALPARESMGHNFLAS